MQDTQGKNSNPGPVELIPCPFCDDGEKKRGFMACYKYHQTYLNDAASAVLEGKEAPSKEEWGLSKLPERIPVLERISAEIRQKYEYLRGRTNQETERILQEKTAGKMLAQDLLVTVKKKIEETDGTKFWYNNKGPRMVWELRISEKRLFEAKRLLRDLTTKQNSAIGPLSKNFDVLKETREVVNGSKEKTAKENKDDPPHRHSRSEKSPSRNGKKTALKAACNDPQAMEEL